MPVVKPTLFLILDGYGLAPAGPGNAASLAHTPTLDRLLSMPGMGRLLLMNTTKQLKMKKD